MAIENLIESRIKNPKIRSYSEEDKKFYAELEKKGYKNEIKKIILADAFDNLIFCATDDFTYYYYAYKCKNTEADVNEVLSKTKGITKDSPCYSFNCLNFPEEVSHSFYEFEGEVYHNYFSLNDELDRIQRKIDFLNHENALVHSLESALKNVKYTFDFRSLRKTPSPPCSDRAKCYTMGETHTNFLCRILQKKLLNIAFYRISCYT